MPMHRIEFSYQVPEFGTIELDARNVEEAEDLARQDITHLYPEALDVVIEDVTVIS